MPYLIWVGIAAFLNLAIVRLNGGLDAYGPGVLAGEHTDEILTTLGRGTDDIAALRAARVVASEPVEWS